jgi:DnaJ-class molecular chaperone
MPPPESHSGTSSNSNESNYQYNPRNAEDVFTEFFNSNKPFGFEPMNRAKSMRFQTEGAGTFGGFGEGKFRPYSEGTSSGGGGAASGGGSTAHLKKPPAVETKLPCSLEELYSGSQRKMKISRTVVRPNGYPLPLKFNNISCMHSFIIYLYVYHHCAKCAVYCIPAWCIFICFQNQICR